MSEGTNGMEDEREINGKGIIGRVIHKGNGDPICSRSVAGRRVMGKCAMNWGHGVPGLCGACLNQRMEGMHLKRVSYVLVEDQ